MSTKTVSFVTRLFIVLMLLNLLIAAASVIPADAAGILYAKPISSGSGSSSSTHPTLIPHTNYNYRPVCQPTKEPGKFYCLSEIVTDATGKALVLPSVLPMTLTSAPYGPAQFRGAYGVSGTTSITRTVAIVDAYNDPTVLSDLNTYSSIYGIPTMSSCAVSGGTYSSPCFQVVNENGGSTLPPSDGYGVNGWAGEISLDVQAVHAICQNCNILLVEATSASDDDLIVKADQTAVSMGANVVSNSWGGSESSGEASYDAYFNHPGVPFVFSTGNNGYGVQYPSASPNVTAVGGTSLNINIDNTYNSETAWNGAGSGCSAYEPKPSFQHDSGCPRRTVADVSADADPNTGAYVVYNGSGYGFGGTSLAAPLVASIYAMAGGVGTTLGNSLPYANANYGVNLRDVTSGSNGSCGGSYLCTAVTGYDGPTGLGTPLGTAAFTVAFDCVAAAVTEIPQTECNALVALYNSTNGASWKNNTNWLQTNTPCSWYGVTCASGHITQLDLSNNGNGNNLIGNIPSQLGNLTNLTYLDLDTNQLSGSIPIELGNLTSLTDLDLSWNQLSGGIPSQLSNLTQLQHLWLGDNLLTGSIPSQLGSLTNLTYLDIDTNQLNGSIPYQLGNLTQLTGLNLWRNQLSGNIPTQLDNLSQLTYLDLSFNQLSSSIPTQLGNLTKLTFLALSDNQLSGSIPTQLGNLTQLTDFEIQSNPLSGSLPISLEKLTQLQDFFFNSTNLCEPSDAAFQNWLNSIYDLQGTNICPVTISGNAGDAGVVLHYTNGTAKTVTSASNGRYSITVPYHWSGTVTPTKAGVTFTPASHTYTSLAVSQTNQNYADTVSFISTATYDGGIIESVKGSGQGGTMNSTAINFPLGDDKLNRQFRAILSFNTASLPDIAVIQSAVIKIKQGGSSGINPFTVLGMLYADIRTGYFGTSPALELADFNAPATATRIGSFGSTPVSGWYNASLNATGKSDINKTNLTQVRLYFATPTNGNNLGDYLVFFSGNAGAGSQPLLTITYSLP